MKLSEAVDLYIQRKRNAGMRFQSPTNRLRSFLRHCGDIDLHHITVQQVTAFLDVSGSMPSGWGGKRGTLRAFFDYWRARGRLKSSPLPPSAPKITQSLVPYIYSRSDLRSLLGGVPRCQRRSACVMSEATFRTLLLFLYATGMRLGEALRLRLMDVDLTLGIGLGGKSCPALSAVADQSVVDDGIGAVSRHDFFHLDRFVFKSNSNLTCS